MPHHLVAHEPRGPRVSSGSSASLWPFRTILSPGTRDSNLALSERVGEMNVGDQGWGLSPKRRGLVRSLVRLSGVGRDPRNYCRTGN